MKKNYIAPEFEELLIDSSEDILKSLEEVTPDEWENINGMNSGSGTTDWENNENQGGGTDDEDDFVDVTP